jgi:hypothetical protein
MLPSLSKSHLPKIVIKAEKPAIANPKKYAITIPSKLKPKTDNPMFSPISAEIMHKISIPNAAINTFFMF